MPEISVSYKIDEAPTELPVLHFLYDKYPFCAGAKAFTPRLR